MSDIVRVGMADYKICSPPNRISTLGLGSCVGVVLYDSRIKLCGLAHMMLPDSNRISSNENRFKFVDTCLRDMRDEMIQMGASKARMVSKIAGGARMFAFDSDNEHLNIGGKNIVATRKLLQKWEIPIISEDTGLTYSRTIEFDPETGDLLIKAIGIGVSII